MKSSQTEKSTTLIEAARSLEPQIRANVNQIEQDRKLPQPLVDAMIEAGLFKMLVPREYGGSEATLETFARVIEEVSRVDGSAGWCVCFPANNGVAAAFFPESTAEEIFGAENAYTAGTGVPAPRPKDALPDRAIAVEGGYRVTGRWSYTSGCMHATWLFSGCDIYNRDTPRVDASGIPERRLMYFPREDCQIIDTWHVSGLRGTGSHDFAVEDIFVPEDRTLLITRPMQPRIANQLYGFGVGKPPNRMIYSLWAGIAPIGLASVCLGTARGALDDLIGLAEVKKDRGGQTLLTDNSVFQDRLGRTEATLRAARAYLFTTMQETWNKVQEAPESIEEQHSLLRLASVHSSILAAEVIDAVWELAGASSVFTAGPFERRFRDIHTALANRILGPEHYMGAGRLFLGTVSWAEA